MARSGSSSVSSFPPPAGDLAPSRSRAPWSLRTAFARVIVGLGNVYRRLLVVAFAILGPQAAYAITGLMARVLYRLLTPLRIQSEAQCRAALGERVPPGDVPRIARQAFIHRIWNLVDLMLADRLLHPGTCHRYGGRLPEPCRSRLLDACRQGRPVILLTAYYGPFDLFPIFLGCDGVRAGVVYRRHDNAGFDIWRRRIRERGGCETIPVEHAVDRLAAILEQGGTVAIVADHHEERRGLPVMFLGLPTMASRSVGLLACRYRAAVAVAGIRRVGRGFRFVVVASDVIEPNDWSSESDPVAYVTRRYLRALERIILEDPTQYLWAAPRWGEALARKLAGVP